MNGYKYLTEQQAIEARQLAAQSKGLPIPGNITQYWVDYQYSEVDQFYYIIYDEGLEKVLGNPIEFEITYLQDN